MSTLSLDGSTVKFSGNDLCKARLGAARRGRARLGAAWHGRA